MTLPHRNAPYKAPVAVLGAGPTGLLAAHAATEMGYEATVFSRPDQRGRVARSDLWGCQYLHAPIPGLTPQTGNPVSYLLDGDPEEYRAKVYGDQWRGVVSPDEYGPEGNHMAWDLRAAYRRLWEQWSMLAVPVNIGANSMTRLVQDQTFVRIFVTIPAPSLCVDPEHRFPSQDVWVIGEGPDNMLPFRPEPFTVRCNGSRDVGWYRAANVYDYTTIEWPNGKKPPIRGIARVRKPLSTNCDCWTKDSRVIRIGRFGQWRKGVLVHDAYNHVKETLK